MVLSNLGNGLHFQPKELCLILPDSAPTATANSGTTRRHLEEGVIESLISLLQTKVDS